MSYISEYLNGQSLLTSNPAQESIWVQNAPSLVFLPGAGMKGMVLILPCLLKSGKYNQINSLEGFSFSVATDALRAPLSISCQPS